MPALSDPAAPLFPTGTVADATAVRLMAPSLRQIHSDFHCGTGFERTCSSAGTVENAPMTEHYLTALRRILHCALNLKTSWTALAILSWRERRTSARRSLWRLPYVHHVFFQTNMHLSTLIAFSLSTDTGSLGPTNDGTSIEPGHRILRAATHLVLPSLQNQHLLHSTPNIAGPWARGGQASSPSTKYTK